MHDRHRHPQRLAARAGRRRRAARGAHARLPGRFLLGIGIGHPEATSDYTRPLTAMRAFFDGLDAADPPVPRDERIAAALGPEDARPRGRAVARRAPLLHDARAHALRARARRPGQARRPGARRRGGDRRRDGAREGARATRRPTWSSRNYTSQPAALRLQRGRHRRRRQRPADRRGHPARLRGGDRRGGPAHFDAGADHVCAAAARPRPGAGRRLPGAGRARGSRGSCVEPLQEIVGGELDRLVSPLGGAVLHAIRPMRCRRRRSP